MKQNPSSPLKVTGQPTQAWGAARTPLPPAATDEAASAMRAPRRRVGHADRLSATRKAQYANPHDCRKIDARPAVVNTVPVNHATTRGGSAPASMTWMSSLYKPKNGAIQGSPTSSPKSWRRARSFTGPTKTTPFSKSLNNLTTTRPHASPSLTRRSSWPRRPSSSVEVLATEYATINIDKKKSKALVGDGTQLPGLPNTPKLSRAKKLGLPAVKTPAATNASPLVSRASSPSSFTTVDNSVVIHNTN